MENAKVYIASKEKNNRRNFGDMMICNVVISTVYTRVYDTLFKIKNQLQNRLKNISELLV